MNYGLEEYNPEAHRRYPMGFTPQMVSAYDWRDRSRLETLCARVDSLYDVIAHGDEKHRDWLRKAIAAHLNGRPVPPPT